MPPSYTEIENERAERLNNPKCTDTRCDGILWDQLGTQTCSRCGDPVCAHCIKELFGLKYHPACWLLDIEEGNEVSRDDFENAPDDYRNSEAR